MSGDCPFSSVSFWVFIGQIAYGPRTRNGAEYVEWSIWGGFCQDTVHDSSVLLAGWAYRTTDRLVGRSVGPAWRKSHLSKPGVIGS